MLLLRSFYPTYEQHIFVTALQRTGYKTTTYNHNKQRRRPRNLRHHPLLGPLRPGRIASHTIDGPSLLPQQDTIKESDLPSSRSTFAKEQFRCHQHCRRRSDLVPRTPDAKNRRALRASITCCPLVKKSPLPAFDPNLLVITNTEPSLFRRLRRRRVVDVPVVAPISPPAHLYLPPRSPTVNCQQPSASGTHTILLAQTLQQPTRYTTAIYLLSSPPHKTQLTFATAATTKRSRE